MKQAPTQNQREPVGHEWLEPFRRLFEDEFPEPECDAARAVEGHETHPRDRAAARSERFQGGGA